MKPARAGWLHARRQRTRVDMASVEEKDELLRRAFTALSARGIDSPFTRAPRPFTELLHECQALNSDTAFSAELQRYLRVHSTLPRSLEMFFTYIALSARVDWRSAPDPMRPIAARAWFLGRWLPTFLVLDGPVGRFLCANDSPFNTRIGASLPLLTGARDFFNDRLFRLLRNGFAHWAFHWEVVGGHSYVVAYDPERDLPTAKLHQEEADAFHIAAFAIIEVLNGAFLAKDERLRADA